MSTPTPARSAPQGLSLYYPSTSQQFTEAEKQREARRKAEEEVAKQKAINSQMLVSHATEIVLKDKEIQVLKSEKPISVPIETQTESTNTSEKQTQTEENLIAKIEKVNQDLILSKSENKALKEEKRKLDKEFIDFKIKTNNEWLAKVNIYIDEFIEKTRKMHEGSQIGVKITSVVLSVVFLNPIPGIVTFGTGLMVGCKIQVEGNEKIKIIKNNFRQFFIDNMEDFKKNPDKLMERACKLFYPSIYEKIGLNAFKNDGKPIEIDLNSYDIVAELSGLETSKK